jgi:hypothetical protein
MVLRCLMESTSNTLYVSPTRLKQAWSAAYEYHRFISIISVSASLHSLQPAMKTAPTGQDAPKRPKSLFSTTRAHNSDLLSKIFYGGCKYVTCLKPPGTSTSPRHALNPAHWPNEQSFCLFEVCGILDFRMFKRVTAIAR